MTDVVCPPFARALVVAIVLFAVQLAQPPLVVLTSDAALPQYGISLAAEGQRIATIDGSSDQLVLRVDFLEGTRVRRESTVPLAAGFRIPAVALRGDTIVVHLDTHELRFFQRKYGRWLPNLSVMLPAECRDVFFNDIHLGERVLVVESRDVWCVLEPSALGVWSISATLPHGDGERITVSRSRILISTSTEVRQFERSSAGWHVTRTITPPRGTYYSLDFAASDRWLVIRDDDDRLHVHDLDANARLFDVLEMPGGRDAKQIAVRGQTLVTSDDIGGIAWKLTDRWRVRAWLDIPSNAIGYHPVTLGGVIWIGTPLLDGGGRIHGFTVDEL